MPDAIKVGLVQINNSFENSSYFPYSVGLLQAYFQKYSAQKDRFEFLEPVYRRMPLDQMLAKLQGARILGISAYVWNYQISLELARRFKKLNPEALVVFGGCQVPDRSEEFLREHGFIDLAIHAQGEDSFKLILEHFHDRDWSQVEGVSYLQDGRFVQRPKQERISDLDSIPSPYLEGVFDQLMKNNPREKWLGLWETNRGCPFSCAYCDWGSATQARMYEFGMERLRAEMDWFAANQVEFIFCCDSNFGLLKRDLEIVEFVAKVKERTGYPEALSVQNTKNATERSYAIQKTLSQAGLNKGVTLALQTVDRTALENVGRKNISLASFEELQRRYNRDGVETYSDLILALPGETYDSFTRGVSRIIENGQHNRIQFNNLSILPNARMGDKAYQEKYNMIIVPTGIINIHGSLAGSDDGIHESQDLVVGTDSMPPEDWVKVRAFSWMCSFLYFDKIMQIPLALLIADSGVQIHHLVEAFLEADPEEYPILAGIAEFFLSEARNLQKGGPEYCRSREWLNIYWPHDEYVFIDLVTGDRLAGFYAESQRLISRRLQSLGQEAPAYLPQAMALNEALIKRPFMTNDLSLVVDCNLWEAYRKVVEIGRAEFEYGAHQYHIDRTTETWNTWQDWYREVVWYGNKKGAYLYRPVRQTQDGTMDSRQRLAGAA